MNVGISGPKDRLLVYRWAFSPAICIVGAFAILISGCSKPDTESSPAKIRLTAPAKVASLSDAPGLSVSTAGNSLQITSDVGIHKRDVEYIDATASLVNLVAHAIQSGAPEARSAARTSIAIYGTAKIRSGEMHPVLILTMTFNTADLRKPLPAGSSPESILNLADSAEGTHIGRYPLFKWCSTRAHHTHARWFCRMAAPEA